MLAFLIKMNKSVRALPKCNPARAPESSGRVLPPGRKGKPPSRGLFYASVSVR